MPSHRAPSASGLLGDLEPAPLGSWEDRLRESSSWASQLVPLDSLADVLAPVGEEPQLVAAGASRAGAGAGSAAARAWAPLASGGSSARHSTGPVPLSPPAPVDRVAPEAPAARVPAPRGPVERSFAPARGRRALPDLITDASLVLADLPLPVRDAGERQRPVAPAVSADARPAAAREEPAARASGRRRSHAAVDAVPVVRERPVAAAGPSLAPPQTRRGRRAAAARASAPLGEDDSAHAAAAGGLTPGLWAPPSPAPAPALVVRGFAGQLIGDLDAGAELAGGAPERRFDLAGSWGSAPADAPPAPAEPTAEGLAAGPPVVLDDELGATALLELPPGLWDLDDTPVAQPVPTAAPASPAPLEPVDADDPDPAGDVRAFVPSRARSAHRRPRRAFGVLPQAGLVGALGLATVLAPVAASAVPFLPGGHSTTLPTPGASLLPSPVAAAAHAILGTTSATTASDALAGRHRATASRSASRQEATAAATGPSTAASSASSATSSASTASASAPAASTGAASTTPATAAASVLAPSAAAATGTTTSTASTATTSAQTAEDAAVAALVPGCTGKTPDTSGELNGRLDDDSLCDLWQSGESLRSDAAVAFAKLNVAYKAHFGTDMVLSASYRPYADQVRLKRSRPAYAAVPGTSEHGWGLAVDLGDGVQNSDEHYTWLMENAPKYGWAHPAWAQKGGGGPYEPWHWEYVAGE